MKKKNEIITEIFNDDTYRKISSAFTKNKELAKELHSIFISIICHKTEEQLQQVYSYINNYCCQILVNQYYSSASTFYYQFRRYQLKHILVDYFDDNSSDMLADDIEADSHLMHLQSMEEQQALIEQINNIVDSQHFYNQRMFRLWLEAGSVRKLAAQFENSAIKISKTAIQKSVKQTKNIIKQHLKDNNATIN